MRRRRQSWKCYVSCLISRSVLFLLWTPSNPHPAEKGWRGHVTWHGGEYIPCQVRNASVSLALRAPWTADSVSAWVWPRVGTRANVTQLHLQLGVARNPKLSFSILNSLWVSCTVLSQRTRVDSNHSWWLWYKDRKDRLRNTICKVQLDAHVDRYAHLGRSRD